MNKRNIISFLSIVVFLLTFNVHEKSFCQKSWLTQFEKTGGLQTSKYDETIAFCERLADYSSQLSLFSFGISPQGRDLPYLILDQEGAQNIAELKASGKLILMIQACIHAGEPDGKDAGLILFRDIVTENIDTKMLDEVSVVFIPIFNVDGHERFGAFNRINQNGPEEMGWRANARSLNLNRDYIKAESQEMKAWLKLYNQIEPDFFIDCHTTDGADYQYVATYAMEVFGGVDKALSAWQKHSFIPYLEDKMKEQSMPIFPYVSFRNWHDPRSGLISEVGSPMISQAYVAQRNRPALLIETHMLKNYRLRVDATYQMLKITLDYLAKHPKTIRKMNAAADQAASDLAFQGKLLPLSFQVSTQDSTQTKFLGVEYGMKKSDLTGGNWFTYNNKEPETFKIPYFKKNIPVHSVILPSAYIIPPQWKAVINKLNEHGVYLDTLNTETELFVEIYKLKNPKWSTSPFEGNLKLVDFELESQALARSFPKGSIIVKSNQAQARIIAHILEPYSDNSLLRWGYFNTIFEQKEYGESYVMEPLARKMLAENKELKAAYEKKKREDAEFAKNSWAQINWFYQHTPYWDREVGVYPIGRVMGKTILGALEKNDL